MRGATAVLLWICMAALSGCDFREHGLGEPSPDGSSLADGPVRDGAVADGPARDAAPDARDCDWGIPTTNFDPCGTLPASNGVLDLQVPATIDTDSGAVSGSGAPATLTSSLLSQSAGPSMRVLVFSALSVRAPLRFIGSRPVLVVALDRIEASGAGVIDVSALSGDGRRGGPGADDATACATGRGDNGGFSSSEDGASGGAGAGAYGANGGRGGMGGGSNGGTSGPAGATNGTTNLSPLRGGCGGGPGGGPTGSAGGGGGGALQLAAKREIVVESGARLLASGGGGEAPGNGNDGGSGGGSGGAILLESPRVRLLAGSFVCANGGSGGEGTGSGADGVAGGCGVAVGALTPNQSALGGDGGIGGFAAMGAGGFGGSSVSGGGGGGGSVGRVRLHTTVQLVRSGTVTPEPVED